MRRENHLYRIREPYERRNPDDSRFMAGLFNALLMTAVAGLIAYWGFYKFNGYRQAVDDGVVEWAAKVGSK